ncbi:MAG: DUF3857 domain-containing protein [Archangium sp.]
MRPLLCLLVALSACTASRRAVELTNRFTYDPRDYPNDAAVVLHRSDRTQMFLEGSDAYTRSSRREVVAVLSEGGLDRAEVRIPFDGDSTLYSFTARIYRPDGTSQVLGEEALLADDGNGEHDGNARYFRFPNATVGSVLDSMWTIESPRLWAFDEQDTLGEYPVRHYEFELKAPTEMVLETIELNGGAPINIVKGEEHNTLSFSLDNLPARRDVDAQPHWTFTEPRWAWRVVAMKYGPNGKYTYDWLRDWKDVVTGYGDLYFNHGLDDGFDVPFDIGDCGSVTCVAQRAVDMVREHTEQTDVQWNRAARLIDAWHSGRASNVEQVLMVKALLEREGLKVWLGFGTGLLNRQTMPFPNTSQFDRLFAVVRPQNGVTSTLLIDPTCAACRAGELSPEYAELPICAFRTGRRVDEAVSDVVWEQPNVKSPPSTVAIAHVARLTPDGALEDDVKVTARGTLATPLLEQWKHQRASLTNGERRLAQASSPLAIVRNTSWSACDASSCGWTTSLRFEREASHAGQRWLVPTSFLRATWEELFLADTRDIDVHFQEREHYEEVADVVAPPGLQLVSMPESVTGGRDGFQVDVKWERTPTGARVTRKLTQEIVSIPAGRYSEVRATIEAFRQARREVLVFAPRQ